MTRTFIAVATFIVTAQPGAAQLPRTRDSAGIHIVENAARAKAPVAWRLAEKATYDVGGLKDNLDDELNKNSAYLKDIRLSDGRHAVDDQIRLRFFDAAGKQTRVVGRQGQGPGEFQYIDALCRTHGDTIVASDPGNGRVTVFNNTGNIVREIPVARTYLLRDGCLDDGSFILTETTRPASGPAVTTLVRRGSDGTVLGSVGAWERRPTNLFVTDQLLFAAWGQRIYIADPRTNEVKAYNPQGKLVALIRTADAMEKTTASEQAAMMPMVAPATTDQAILDRFKERVRTEPHPAEWPSYGRMLIDPDGRVWLEDYARDRTAPRLWTGFDASGRMIGRFTMPATQKNGDPRVDSFTSGGVLILHDDSDGAHHLTTYALVPVK